MVGGYVSVDDIINTAVVQNYPTYIEGSFELAKSLVNSKKPIIGVMVRHTADERVVATYIGSAFAEPNGMTYISAFCFEENNSMTCYVYTITNTDIVTLIEI